MSPELRALMDQRRACWPDNVYPMPGDPRLDRAADLTVQIIRKSAAEGLREVEAWNQY